MTTTIYDNKYHYIQDLGIGGFGRVFLAKEDVSEKLFAIKELKNKDPLGQANIIKEIKQVAAFNHDGIVRYITNFRQDGLLYLVMEYCEQGNLYDRQKAKPISVAQIIDHIKQIALSCAYVHEKKIVHHDIKPANILVTDNGKVKIADFGIANTGGGTRPYMCPESFDHNYNIVDDPRTDIYALGVTLMELLCGNNPFFGKVIEEIIAMHDSKNFPIKHLSQWQQDIILKAINKIPELRFQTMKDFAEALELRQVPVFLNKEIIEAGEFAEKLERMLVSKKWLRVGKFVEEAALRYPDAVNILTVSGKFYLLQNKIPLAKKYYEKALSLNPRLEVQKELAEINISLKNYPIAISLISDHLHRHPSDYEAYNLLMQCYYETNRYEAGMELGKVVLRGNAGDPILANNYYLCHVMQNIGNAVLSETVLKARNNPFIDYNMSVCFEDENKLSHAYEKNPTLKSKLLFADYRFHKLQQAPLFFTDTDAPGVYLDNFKNYILKFGREGYNFNTIEVPDGNAVSRRHCLIINTKDDVWLYNLNSTGTYLNEQRVPEKAQIIGKNTLQIHKTVYTITTDNKKFF